MERGRVESPSINFSINCDRINYFSMQDLTEHVLVSTGMSNEENMGNIGEFQ